MDNDVTVADAPEQHRYEARDASGALMGIATYRRISDHITFLHTETMPEFQGRGVAGQIAKQSLEDARAAGLKVKPACPYYRQYFEKHPEYADLLGEVAS
ncbi:GNAT family N-acetyltransferase [Kribbella sp. ALI-6-A]|uniref:GNAT family N-acetyltransferase n=1 Tax=Kribbella sp. ALI-6-A TaxID=1933817 RepID=UPI00097C6DD3|nr:GNAT family N-acetyltransferase [Kribbella sp. ALI-6-A]ONI69344.1 GNAT family N-acetyltransferase [Kribbella sp. ALI-6-A]